jgi:hypothetical protein
VDPNEQQPPDQPTVVPFPRGYVNFAAGSGGPLDFSLMLGFREGPANSASVVAPLVMAWEFVPLLIQVLQTQLDAYEEQVGPVRDLGKLESGKEPE